MWRSYGIILLFAITYWVPRVYTISPYWDGTDGNGLLANIFLHNIHGPYYIENALADGQMHFAPPFHPALLYEIPRLIGVPLNFLFHIENSDAITCAVALKCISATIQYIFFGILFWLALSGAYKQPHLRYFTCFVIILVSASPVALMSSNEFQTDTFSGVFLIGGSALLLVVSARAKTSTSFPYTLLAMAGILLGCGKNEWSSAFVLAVLASVAVGILCRSKDICLKAAAIGSGLIMGNILSCGIDPTNYCYGWTLISSMVTAHSALGTPKTYHLYDTLSQILPYTVTLYILAGLVCVFAFINRGLTAAALMLFFSGVALLIGYSLSSWSLVSRYFYPSLLLLLGLVVLLSGEFRSREMPRMWMAPVLALLFISNLYFDFALFQRAHEIRAWQREHGPLVLQPLGPDEAYLLDMCFLLPKVDQNYVHAWVGNETILYHQQWAHKKLKLDGIKEYPPYTTFPTPYIEPAKSHND